VCCNLYRLADNVTRPLVLNTIGSMTSDVEQEIRVRYRRTKSVSRAEDLQKEEARVRRSQPDKP